MKTVYFEDIEEGDELPGIDLFLSKDAVRQFAKTANMYVPRFTDDEGARAEGLPGMIAPGVMSMGLLARMISDWNPAAVVKRIGATFRSPVLPDRNVHLRGAVTQKNEQDHTVECDIWLENDDGERWVIGTATVAAPSQA
ncbi:MAG TPA: MaoC/PaaZ C-terminal domain-containing protein [Methylomirabilota bacterium]|jgi:acyl dehydratase|nr:MaoC/PaaZ C-terminal domain-containing protein [Methylomirabilota bacterium]